MRLNKFIANSGICSRRKADKLIEDGCIVVNGEIISDYSYSVSLDDIVEFNGNKIIYNKINETYILNKPKGFISSNYDRFNKRRIVDLIDTNSRLFSIGRLDLDTTGVILLTNDGDLSYKLSHPKFQVEKRYIAYTVNDVNDKELYKFKSGFIVNGQNYKAEIKRIKKYNNYFEWDIGLTEGKNREIKKIFNFLDAPVINLHRYSFAGLLLDNLKSGESRALSSDETNVLYKL